MSASEMDVPNLMRTKVLTLLVERSRLTPISTNAENAVKPARSKALCVVKQEETALF